MITSRRAVSSEDDLKTVSSGSWVANPRRIVRNSSGSIYAVILSDGSSGSVAPVFQVAKWPTQTNQGAVTVYSSSGEVTAFTTSNTQQHVACDIDSSDILHIVYIVVNGGVKRTYHKKFDTTDDTWVSGETTIASGGSTSVANGSVDVWVDAEDNVHAAWLNFQSANSYKLYYSRTTDGTWASATEVDSRASSCVPVYSCKLVVNRNLQAFIFAYDFDNESGWTMYDISGGSATVIDGIGQISATITDDGLIHAVFVNDRRHSIISQTTIDTTLGAFQFEQPYAHGGFDRSGTTAYTSTPYASIVAHGNDLYMFTISTGRIFQATYTSGVWSNLSVIGDISTGANGDSAGYSSGGIYVVKSTADKDAIACMYKANTSDGNNVRWTMAVANSRMPDRAGITHDITIDGVGYSVEGILQKADISQAIPRVSISTELRREENISDLSSSTQESWHHGRGDKIFANPVAFLDADNLLTHIPNQITPPYAEVATEDLNGYPVDMILYQGNLYALIYGNTVADNSLQVWDNTNSEWDAVVAGLDTGTGSPSDLEIYNEDLWVAQGDQDLCRVYDFSALTWMDATVPAYCLKEWDGLLWRADNINEIYYSEDADLIGSESWSLLGTVDDGAGTTSRIRGFEPYAGTLLVFADMGVWQIIPDNGNYALRPILNDEPNRNLNNGRARANWGGVLFYNVEDSVTRFDGNTRLDVGPNRSPVTGEKFTPMIATKFGIPSSMVATDTLLYMSVDPNDTSTGRATVQVYSGTGWNEFWKSDTNGARCKFIFYTPKLAASGVLSKRVLWVNQGDVIKYIVLPANGENPLHDSTITYKENFDTISFHEGYKLITGWMDRSLPALQKVEHEIILRSDNLETTTSSSDPRNSVAIFYQIDEDSEDTSFDVTNWNYLGLFTESPYQVIRINDVVERYEASASMISGAELSGAVGGLSYTRIRYMLVVNSYSTTAPAVIHSFGQRFTPRTQPRYGFTSIIKAYREVTNLDGSLDERTPSEIRNKLFALTTKPGPHQIDDGSLPAVINYVYNGSFEAGTTLATYWDEVNAANVTTALSSKHKVFGSKSQKVTGTATAATETGISQTLRLRVPAGVSSKAGAYIYVPPTSLVSPGVVLLAEAGGTVLAQSEPVHAPTLLNMSNAPTFVSIDIPAQSTISSITLKVVIPAELAVGRTFEYYVDGVFFYLGDDSPYYFIDGYMARCNWAVPTTDTNLSVTDYSLVDTLSIQRGYYICYFTGLNEAFRYRGGNLMGSQITLFMREASG